MARTLRIDYRDATVFCRDCGGWPAPVSIPGRSISKNKRLCTSCAATLEEESKR
jgi:hypothetical protein